MKNSDLPKDLSSLPADGGSEFNRLIFEKSPYLLQHARNPLDWYPWCEEAFARARREDKPVFLSIGYSTCHWCHVMEKEAFEDEEVADFLNRHFISIKVDREERPDIDATYMNVCQMMNGSGGWPLNLVLTPGKQAFFAATYLPKRGRGGMAGLLDIAGKIVDLWRSDRERLTQTGEQVREALQRLEQRGAGEEKLDPQLLDAACRQFLGSFDQRHAGFGDAPKFPSPHNLSLLLRIAARKDEEKARVMALQTLQQMRLGGIYDQLGFGMHRYSVDARWLVPHFEKMLYDQATAALAYLEGYQASGDPFFAQTAQEILEYTGRDLSDARGGFYCGEDADSEGEEGTFYVWDKRQILEILGDQDGALFCGIFGVTEEGNFEGSNILHLSRSLEEVSAEEGIALQELVDRLGRWRIALFREREKRPRPHRDEKILTGWNGLMIAAFARAGATLAQPELTARAGRAADFVLSELRNDAGRLLRRYCDGEARIPAFLEDYAFFVYGLTELFLATQEAGYLQTALTLSEEMEKLFADGGGSFYDTGSDSETVLVRSRSTFDGALPSGNSVAALNLLRLGRLHGDAGMEARGEKALTALAPQARKYPQGHSQLLIALDFALGPVDEVVLVPAAEEGAENFRDMLRAGFRPRTLSLEKQAGQPEVEKMIPTLAGKQAVGGRATAYLCRDRACREPVTDPEKLEAMLAGR